MKRLLLATTVSLTLATTAHANLTQRQVANDPCVELKQRMVRILNDSTASFSAKEMAIGLLRQTYNSICR
jgi:hypothetical protein